TRRPARRADPRGRGGGRMTAQPTGLLRPTRQTVIGGLLGGAATASGIALTATSGWLIVRAREEPIILTLMVAIVAVRTFGIARPKFRYLERLVSDDAALDDLAGRRPSRYTPPARPLRPRGSSHVGVPRPGAPRPGPARASLTVARAHRGRGRPHRCGRGA